MFFIELSFVFLPKTETFFLKSALLLFIVMFRSVMLKLLIVKKLRSVGLSRAFTEKIMCTPLRFFGETCKVSEYALNSVLFVAVIFVVFRCF